jgi:hypothetical protein
VVKASLPTNLKLFWISKTIKSIVYPRANEWMMTMLSDVIVNEPKEMADPSRELAFSEIHDPFDVYIQSSWNFDSSAGRRCCTNRVDAATRRQFEFRR